jgi:hypothetical protein
MTEVDIWIKVFDKLKFKFIDEFCGPGDVNYIKYKHIGGLNHDLIEYSLYFNRKTEMVDVLFGNSNSGFFNTKITKQSFYNQYIDVFRDIKLEYLT